MARSEQVPSETSPSENTGNVIKMDMTTEPDNNTVVLFLQVIVAVAQQTLLKIWLCISQKSAMGTFQISRLPTDLWNEAGVVSGNIGCVQRAKCPSQGSQILQIGLWPYQLETPHPNMLTRKSQLFDCPTSFETGNGKCVYPLREKETLQD